MSDLISVLMCVYNTPIEYLSEAVDSILSQTYKNIEFIIVDDGSDEPDIVNFLSEIESSSNNVKLIRNDKNLGLTQSLNIGLKQCSGKYIARMDADDISHKDRIQKQVEYMNANDDIALLGTGIYSFGDGIENKNEQLNYQIGYDDFGTYKVKSLLQHSGPPHPTFMFRASFLQEKNIWYREDILKAQDYGIMADILRADGVIRKLNEPLLMYRVHQGQISMKSEIEQKAYQCRVSFDYISDVFPSLSEPERACISTLGCDYSTKDILATVENNDILAGTCWFLIKYREYLNMPQTYISAIKKIIKFNAAHNVFGIHELESEFRYRWWKKAFRTSKRMHKPWGMSAYTIMSYRYVH